uniref:Uncharacterized protein n=1 Tax=Tanacetum cinerariifolium TaxID=118510 RepID=A0A699TRJ2_TANCI|nr:hypothetical protein [Tanacetum cinerariifolium]
MGRKRGQRCLYQRRRPGQPAGCYRRGQAARPARQPRLGAGGPEYSPAQNGQRRNPGARHLPRRGHQAGRR